MRLLLALLVAGMLAGCGVRFRSDASFPPEMEATYVNAADRYSPFYQALIRALDRSGVLMTGDPAAANTIIRIRQDQTGKRVLSVSARNVPREYDIYYTIRYSVLVNGEEVLPEQTITLTQDYTYDERQVLGKGNEERILRNAIAENLVDLVARQLNTSIL